MLYNPKKIIGALGRRYGGRPFQRVRAACYDAVRLGRDLRGTLCVCLGLPAPASLDRELDTRLYHDRPEPPAKPGVVCMLDGEMNHGGLTDRLRGILTAYRETRRLGLPFYIFWTSPFPLTDYLLPATFDWRISPREISRSRANARAVVIDDMNETQSLLRLRAALRSHLNGSRPQLHLYTNADSARGDYAELYRELFVPSPALLREVERHTRILGPGYRAVATRFLTLLGDFTDWYETVLDEKESAALLDKVTAEFHKIAARFPKDSRILVTSDSRRFLEHIRHADPRIYIVEGDIGHIDLNRDRGDDTWMKTLVDQQLLMGAAEVVRMRTGRMYAGGFPRFAAEVGGTRFTDHPF
ncbi:MAG: hypothetical protein K2O24_00015 [Muribaculaceae bacterium]|nr:hypothetical protein [Muribaculaceae bacterium]